MDNKLQTYLIGTLPTEKKWVKDMQEQAKAQYIPIMDNVSMNFVMQLIRMTKPKRILEVGTAIGYSALRMLEAYPKAEIITVEIDDYRFSEAMRHITLQKKQAHIQAIHGDALEVLSCLTSAEPFDLIFIDAAKGKYKEFFELASPLLREEGIILTDNVLFRGNIAGSTETEHKYRNLVQKIKDYNKWLIGLADFTTSIVPIGDGLTISYKQSNEGSTNCEN